MQGKLFCKKISPAPFQKFYISYFFYKIGRVLCYFCKNILIAIINEISLSIEFNNELKLMLNELWLNIYMFESPQTFAISTNLWAFTNFRPPVRGQRSVIIQSLVLMQSLLITQSYLYFTLICIYLTKIHQ